MRLVPYQIKAHNRQGTGGWLAGWLVMEEEEKAAVCVGEYEQYSPREARDAASANMPGILSIVQYNIYGGVNLKCE